MLGPERSSLAERAVGACAAPASALYLRPDGYVAACCASWQVLGRVAGPERRPLRDIWAGVVAEQLRAAVAEHDYGLGCWECGQAAAAGRRSESMAASYDSFTPTGHPLLMDFALSNRCNLQCVMCNGGLSSSIRRHREGRPELPSVYDDRFFEELDEFLPSLRVATFKGGEPFLIPEYRRIWDRLMQLGGRRTCNVTTNGTIFNSRVERYVLEVPLHVSVSVDAVDPDLLAAIRVGVDPDRLWANIDRLQRLTERAGTSFTLIFCLMASNWRELGPFLEVCERRGAIPEIIWVGGPRDHNLLACPTEVLAGVLRRYEDLAEAGSLGGISLAVLHAVLQRLQAHVEPALQVAAAVTPVAIGAPASGPSLEQVRTDLAGGDALGLVEIDMRNEVVSSIRVPAWATWIDAAAWIGTGLEQVVTTLTTAVDRVLRSEVESLPGGAFRAWFSATDPRRPLDLVVYYVPPRAGSDLSHLVIGPSEVRSGRTAAPAGGR